MSKLVIPITHKEKESNSKNITFKIRKDNIMQLKKLCNILNISQNEFIRQAIEHNYYHYIEEKEDEQASNSCARGG